MANLVVIIAGEALFAQLCRVDEQNEQNQMNARKKRNAIKNPIHSVCRSTLGISPSRKVKEMRQIQIKRSPSGRPSTPEPDLRTPSGKTLPY